MDTKDDISWEDLLAAVADFVAEGTRTAERLKKDAAVLGKQQVAKLVDAAREKLATKVLELAARIARGK